MKHYSFLLLVIIGIINSFGQKQADESTNYKDDISIDWKKNGDTLKLVAKNKLWVPIQVYFHLKHDKSKLKSFLLPPKDSIELTRHAGNMLDSIFRIRFNDSIRVSYSFGHKSSIHPDLQYPYRLPFKKGKKYEVSQGWNGKDSHSSEKSKYAIDFQLNVGEPVYAARGGTVIKVID